ncbi:hypothetical protein [Bergeriella denitrificans]|uniref:Uncharacterized protein n=1 Tax=Bergeriella denitrificans TaxID=494 RepID=A0A378UJ54_BERDE|nr:hypothetical protein [Bergeriella denitrificans]STZ77367.1 Uncharacterised protein [Bergeriella denitrificans]
MSEFIGLYGRVADVKAVKSLGVCRVVVEVPIEQHKAVTNGFWDADVLVTLSDGRQAYGVAKAEAADVEEAADAAQDYGAYYQTLYKKGFFNNPSLWFVIGSDEAYQQWTRSRPSAISNKGDWVEEIGEYRCEYAHVRRVAAGSGTASKPEYSGLPLRHEEHALQHSLGEMGVLQHYGKNINTPSEAAAWFEKKAAENRTAWIKDALHRLFGVESLKTVPPSEFADWAKANGLYAALPAAFK